LFHQLYEPTYALAYAGATFVPSAPQLTSVFEAEEYKAQQRSLDWQLEAKKMGVEVEIKIVTGVGDPGTEILKWSHGSGKKSADMIIMVPKVSRLASFVLGSTTRKILRTSKKPVLLIHKFEANQGTKHAERKISASDNDQSRRHIL
jgi:nucleotide-binding universal stress UspA family protein